MSKIPEGATHYFLDAIIDPFRKKNFLGDWYSYSDITEVWQLISKPLIELYWPITEHPDYVEPVEAWNGDGLPPDGTVCEGRVKNSGNWKQYKILATTKEYLVVVDEQDCETPIRHIYWEFRLLRNPEQIAAKRRELACDKMFGVILTLPEDRRRNGSDICEALYDAGYRKVDK